MMFRIRLSNKDIHGNNDSKIITLADDTTNADVSEAIIDNLRTWMLADGDTITIQAVS